MRYETTSQNKLIKIPQTTPVELQAPPVKE